MKKIKFACNVSLLTLLAVGQWACAWDPYEHDADPVPETLTLTASSADIVLDVEDIQEYGKQLGPNVTYKAIHNGIHDLILSGQPARDEAYQTIFRWLASQKSH